MRRFRPFRRRILIGAALGAALAGTLFAVRVPLADLCRMQGALLFGKGPRFATAADRTDGLVRHPGELRIAILGNWQGKDPDVLARREAFERAVREVNAAGGARGRRLVPEWVCVGTKGDDLQVALVRLAGDASCFAVLTALDADDLLAARPILRQGNLLTIAPGVTNVRLAHSGDSARIFLPNPSDADLAEGIAAWVAKQPSQTLLACHDDDEENLGIVEELQKALTKRAIIGYYRVPFANAGSARARVSVKWMNDFVQAANVVLANRGCDASAERTIVGGLLKDVPGCVVLLRSVSGDWSGADAKRIVIPHRVTDAEASYRSVWLLADALVQAKSESLDAVVAALASCELKTPAGPFRFTPARFEATAPIEVGSD